MSKRVLVSEDTPDNVIVDYIKSGFKPHVLSKRKIKRKDKKTWNKLKSLGLNPDMDLKFGDVKSLHMKYGYDAVNVTGDPIWDQLSILGEPLSKYKVLKSLEMSNMEDAVGAQELVNDVELKFLTVKTVYTYELRDELSGEKEIIEGSRDFCRDMISLGKAWTLDELQSISTKHLTDMGLPADVFTYRGGFWRVKGTDTTLPACRHIFKAKVVIER